ncbi:MAG: hypothetical protein Q4G22_07265 [Paracoccus sp. (in: a-proteobacteria)]|uniref:hypothetical protein n=1 Tax=Paracoccus sp. TaxID=267 RepID=UPI0026DFDF6B|nr:hypothetical protein [Paracoccus sp. (in: a-proteobacteria)]MDO5631621.1 hypothetical protein [Paracoccus sp. (in: a-proteobacteria)]
MLRKLLFSAIASIMGAAPVAAQNEWEAVSFSLVEVSKGDATTLYSRQELEEAGGGLDAVRLYSAEVETPQGRLVMGALPGFCGLEACYLKVALEAPDGQHIEPADIQPVCPAFADHAEIRPSTMTLRACDVEIDLAALFAQH